MSAAVARGRGICAGTLNSAGRLVLLAPPVIVTAGWFLLLHRYVDPARLAPVAVIAINALMALPFVMPLLVPAVRQSFETNDRLAASLGMRGWARFRLADWPGLRRPFALALLVGMLVSIGDFGAVAFFGSDGFVTLPLMLYQRLGSYRMADAAGLALVLLAFCLLLSAFIDRAARPEAPNVR
jgi:thiamine transport system permease protein